LLFTLLEEGRKHRADVDDGGNTIFSPHVKPEIMVVGYLYTMELFKPHMCMYICLFSETFVDRQSLSFRLLMFMILFQPSMVY